MARKWQKDKAGSVPSPFTIVVEYCHKIGDDVETGMAKKPDGKELPILVITHANQQIIIEQIVENIIQIAVLIDTTEELRKKIAGLSEDIQQKSMLVLIQQLLSHGRTVFDLRPKACTKISNVERLVILQQINVSPNDKSAFNRFLDALAEVTTMRAKVLSTFGMLVQEPTKDASKTTSDSLDVMYK